METSPGSRFWITLWCVLSAVGGGFWAANAFTESSDGDFNPAAFVGGVAITLFVAIPTLVIVHLLRANLRNQSALGDKLEELRVATAITGNNVGHVHSALTHLQTAPPSDTTGPASPAS